VTNAEQFWVEMSAHRFLPKVYGCIWDDVQIISARTKFEHQYPRQYERWKVEAFLEFRKELDANMTNLVAFGDN
jgi:hypothetical protein